jgi:hypothetical protein
LGNQTGQVIETARKNGEEANGVSASIRRIAILEYPEWDVEEEIIITRWDGRNSIQNAGSVFRLNRGRVTFPYAYSHGFLTDEP